MSRKNYELWDKRDSFTLKEVLDLWMLDYPDEAQHQRAALGQLIIDGLREKELFSNEITYMPAYGVTVNDLRKIKEKLPLDKALNMQHTPEYPYTDIPIFEISKVGRDKLEEWCNKKGLSPSFLNASKTVSIINSNDDKPPAKHSKAQFVTENKKRINKLHVLIEEIYVECTSESQKDVGARDILKAIRARLPISKQKLHSIEIKGDTIHWQSEAGECSRPLAFKSLSTLLCNIKRNRKVMAQATNSKQ